MSTTTKEIPAGYTAAAFTGMDHPNISPFAKVDATSIHDPAGKQHQAVGYAGQIIWDRTAFYKVIKADDDISALIAEHEANGAEIQLDWPKTYGERLEIVKAHIAGAPVGKRVLHVDGATGKVTDLTEDGELDVQRDEILAQGEELVRKGFLSQSEFDETKRVINRVAAAASAGEDEKRAAVRDGIAAVQKLAEVRGIDLGDTSVFDQFKATSRGYLLSPFQKSLRQLTGANLTAENIRMKEGGKQHWAVVTQGNRVYALTGPSKVTEKRSESATEANRLTAEFLAEIPARYAAVQGRLKSIVDWVNSNEFDEGNVENVKHLENRLRSLLEKTSA